MSEPLISDEEIEHEADSTVDRGLRGYIDAVTSGGNPDQADMEWTADTIEFARRIEALVRKRLAERIRKAQDECDYEYGLNAEACARIIEED